MLPFLTRSVPPFQFGRSMDRSTLSKSASYFLAGNKFAQPSGGAPAQQPIVLRNLAESKFEIRPPTAIREGKYRLPGYSGYQKNRVDFVGQTYGKMSRTHVADFKQPTSYRTYRVPGSNVVLGL